MQAQAPQVLLRFLYPGKLCLTEIEGDPVALLGFSADEFRSTGISLFDRIHAEDSDIAGQVSTPRDSPPGHACVRVRHSDGRIRCLEMDYHWNTEAQPPELTVRLRPPDTMHLAQSLLQPDGWLAVTIAGIDEGIIIKDCNHVYIAASPEFRSRVAHMTGQREIVGLTDYDWIQEPIADLFYRLEKEVLQQGTQLERVVDYNQRWIHVRYTPVRGPSGEICGVFTWNEDATETIRAEEQIDPADQSLGAQMASKMGSYIFDVQRRLFAFSQNLVAILGVESIHPHDVDLWTDLVHPDDLQDVLSHIRSTIASPGRMLNCEHRIVRPSDGEVRWIHALGQVVRKARTGEPLMVRGTMQDITQRKSTEEALRATRDQLQQFVEHAPAAIAMFDREMRYLAVSRRWLESENLTRDIIGRRHYDVVPGLPEKFVEAHNRGLAGDTLRDDEDSYQLADGSTRWLHWEVLPWRSLTGEVAGIILLVEDITHRKEIEAALKESEFKYRRIVSTANEGVLVVGPDNNVESVNPRLAEMLGRTVEEMCRRPMTDFMFEEDIPDHWRKVENRIHGHAEHYERRFRHKDGQTVWTLVSAVPILDEQQQFQGSFAMYADITERKQLSLELERRVRERTAQLEDANHKLKVANRELEAFTNSVSHDLRAPLRHIGSFSHLLNEAYAPQLDELAREYLSKIENSARNMGRLIDDLLNLARVGRNSLLHRPVDMKTIVNGVREILETECHGRNVEWRIGRLPTVSADRSLVGQVYQNLIANSLKFTRSRNPAVIEIGSTTMKGKRVFFVRDNGVGFDMKYSDKLFGAFQRLHRAEDFEGTGIGLATVERIIQRHGGLVWAEAEVDKGAAFYFTLGEDAERSDALQSTEVLQS